MTSLVTQIAINHLSITDGVDRGLLCEPGSHLQET